MTTRVPPEALSDLQPVFQAEELEPEIITNSSMAADIGATLRNCCGASFNRNRGEEGSLAFVVLNHDEKPFALASMSSRDGRVKLQELKANANTPLPELEATIKARLNSQDVMPVQ